MITTAAEGSCRVRPIGAVSVGRAGVDLADLAEMTAAGAVGFSDDGAAVAGEELANRALRALAELGRPLVEHAEDPDVAAGGVMRAGPVAARLGLAGWAAAAELTIVERDLALARATGARIHLTHLSTAASVDAVRVAKRDGVAVTCDVTPHHLALAETWISGDRSYAWDPPGPADAALAYDGSCRVNPPLTTREDAATLLAAVEDGTVDAIATDHAPHPPERKAVPFADAAPGLIGLETALSLGLAAVGAGGLSLVSLIAALSTRPAAIVGEHRGLASGELADLVVFDPVARWRVDAGALASASRNTPLLGRELPGVVRLTIADGRITYRA
jgi:dihydroorotase